MSQVETSGVLGLGGASRDDGATHDGSTRLRERPSGTPWAASDPQTDDRSHSDARKGAASPSSGAIGADIPVSPFR